VTGLHRRLGDPERRVRDVAQHLDELGTRARRALVRKLAWERREVTTLAARLARGGPQPGLRRGGERVERAAERLRYSLAVGVRQARSRLEQAVGRLDALSPLACLARGYAIVRKGDEHGAVVSDAATLTPGDPVALVFAHGRARALIDATEPAKEG
jgi:exodeoxyribonuclease VII large subunit